MRYNHFDPIMDMRVITLVVTDFAGIVLYNHVLNLSVVGTDLDIPLDIATITLVNNREEDVVLRLTRGNTTMSFALGRDSNIQLRLAMGIYDYEVRAASDNALLESHTITFQASSPEGFVINLGPIKPPSNPLLELSVFGAFIGLTAAGIGLFAFRMRIQAARKPAPSSYRRDK